MLAESVAEGRTVPTEPEAAAVLAAYGMPQPRETLARTGAEAVEAARSSFRIGSKPEALT